LNGGECLNVDVGGAAQQCKCNAGWIGQFCETVAPLCPTDESLVCFNGGACMDNDQRRIQIDSLGGETWIDLFTCDCNGTAVDSGDFYGQYCQYAPPCDSKPCFNTGVVCENLGQDLFSCDCSGTTSPNSTLPFTGTLCEISSTTPCDVSPCENGGSCAVSQTGASKYVCTCVGGWTGPTCNLAPTTPTATSGCAATTCQPNGVCVSSSNPASTPAFTQCVCMYGYSGAGCATPPAGCTPTSCENSGVCVGFYGAGATSAACLCPDPWVGQHCQWNSTAYNSATAQSVGLFVVLIFALLSIII